ncbi:uncharacterized protein G2W53_011694 [Senna tora]|uniref:Uncharacterized protein n=1 Tax=Senna tora TaxID=362788 RepID=A0A835CDJ7_9FABA|nr:uncharacterized protein G2W53_011694 [Senna tora]
MGLYYKTQDIGSAYIFTGYITYSYLEISHQARQTKYIRNKIEQKSNTKTESKRSRSKLSNPRSLTTSIQLQDHSQRGWGTQIPNQRTQSLSGILSKPISCLVCILLDVQD